jgi:hypothetical protein
MRLKITFIAFCLLACISLIPLFYTYKEISDSTTTLSRASFTEIEPQKPPDAAEKTPDKPLPLKDNQNDAAEPLNPFDEVEPAPEPEGFPPDDVSAWEMGGDSTNE